MPSPPYAPLIEAEVSTHDRESVVTGTVVLTLRTRITREQMDNIDRINAMVSLMKETLEEILYG